MNLDDPRKEQRAIGCLKAIGILFVAACFTHAAYRIWEWW